MTAAFFDVDRTLLAGFSAMAFLKDRFSNEGISLDSVVQATAGTLRFGMKRTSFPSFLEETSTNLIGRSERELLEDGERVFAQHGLVLFDVEELRSHGGSLRIYARHTECEKHPVGPRVDELREREA